LLYTCGRAADPHQKQGSAMSLLTEHGIAKIINNEQEIAFRARHLYEIHHAST
jgi:hypothetical protein